MVMPLGISGHAGRYDTTAGLTAPTPRSLPHASGKMTLGCWWVCASGFGEPYVSKYHPSPVRYENDQPRFGLPATDR